MSSSRGVNYSHSSENKPRLYIALYDLGGVFGGGISYDRVAIAHEKGEYQWALLIAPKEEENDPFARRYLMRQISTDISSSAKDWEFQSDKVRLNCHDSIIARILIAKVTDLDRLFGVLRISELSGGEPLTSDSNTAIKKPRMHRTWIQDIVTALRGDGKCCKHLRDWQEIEQTCTDYAETVRIGADPHNIPTLDMIS